MQVVGIRTVRTEAILLMVMALAGCGGAADSGAAVVNPDDTAPRQPGDTATSATIQAIDPCTLFTDAEAHALPGTAPSMHEPSGTSRSKPSASGFPCRHAAAENENGAPPPNGQ
jgi:hypothetical protein